MAMKGRSLRTSGPAPLPTSHCQICPVLTSTPLMKMKVGVAPVRNCGGCGSSSENIVSGVAIHNSSSGVVGVV